MEKITFFERLKRSYFDTSFAKQYLKESTGKAVLFLMLITLFFSIPGLVMANLSLDAGINELIEVIDSDAFPGFIYENGALTSKTGEPFKYEYNGAVILLDTVNAYSVADLDGYETGMLLDTNSMIIYSGGIETISMPYEDFMLGYFDETAFKESIRGSMTFTYVLINIALVISNLLLLLFGVLFSMLMVSMYKRSFDVTLKKGDGLKIGLYSLALPITIYQLISLLPFIPGMVSLLILFILSSRYITKSISSMKMDNKNKPNDNNPDFTPNIRDYVDLDDSQSDTYNDKTDDSDKTK